MMTKKDFYKLLPIYLLSFLVGGIVVLLLPRVSVATSLADFQAGNIISDANFTNAQSMSVFDIQNFLNSKLSSCDTNGTKPATEFGYPNLTHAQYAANRGWAGPPYTCLKDYNENGLGAAQIIFNLSQQYSINPQVLIVTLQKESSLVTDTWPLPSQYRTATGYGCPDSGPNNSANCNSQYYGLTNQLTNTAYMYHAIMTQNPNWYSPYVVGTNYIQWNPNSSCGGSNVTIHNWATAALYDYTPYQPNASSLAAGYGTGDSCGAYGNRNFWLYFNDWFGNTAYPPSPVYIPNGTYTISGVGSGKNLDVIGGSSNDGTGLNLYDNNGSGAQKWAITRDNEGFYTIINTSSGKYLDAQGGSTKPGTKIDIWTGNGSCAQKWVAQMTSSGYVFLNSCSGLALDVLGGGTSNSTPIQLYMRNSSAAQSWNLTSLDQPVVANGLYSVLTTAGTAIDVPGGSIIRGTALQIYSNNGSGSQIWQFTRQSNGLYTIYNPQSGRYLDVSGASTTPGTNVQIYDGNRTCSQQWSITVNNDNSYALVSACSGLNLNVAGGAVSVSGTFVTVSTGSGTSAQKWTLSKLASNTIPNGYYSLLTTAGTALDVPGGSTRAGTALQIYENNGTGSQVWKLTKQSGGLYSLYNPQSDKYLDVIGASTIPGISVQIYDGNGTCSQLWSIVVNLDGTYGFTSSCSTLQLDITGNRSSVNGTRVDIHTSNGTSAQKWTLGQAAF